MKMIEQFKEFIKKAGKYAVEKRSSAHKVSYKFGDDNVAGLVTEVDLTVSQMFREFIAQNFADLNYIIIDEESIGEFGGYLFEKVKRSEYQFVIDPIDGTINYDAGVPLYGISIAVLKKGKPIYGFLYAPAFDELVYSDGNEVWFECGNEKQMIEAGQKSHSRIVQGHSWDIDIKARSISGKYIMQDYFSAVIMLIYVVLGRVKACFMRANLWDIAAGLVICRALGMGFYDYGDGAEMFELVPEKFTEQGKVRQMHIVGFKDEYAEIKNLTLGLRGGEAK